MAKLARPDKGYQIIFPTTKGANYQLFRK